MNGNDNSTRRAVVRTVLLSSLVFLVLLLAGVFTVKKLPDWRLQWIETDIRRENFEKSYARIERIEDTDTRAEYLTLCSYAEAKTLLRDEKWTEAEALLTGIAGYEDADELLKECRYGLGCQCLADGEWERAAALFHDLMAYGDAPEKEKEAIYGSACARREQGDLTESFLQFREILDRWDAAEQARELAVELTGEADLEKAFARLSNMTEEQLQLREELTAYRARLPVNIIDAGFAHTVALRSDGTVLACGDNAFGQCEVSGWSGVTQVTAGAYHTVALLKDGTVRVAGRDTENQAAVSDWKDVVQIAAADYATFGLKADGTVLYCGYNDYYMLDSWSEVTKLTGGSYSVGALRKNGEALISHRTARSEQFTDLADLAVSTSFAVGLKIDGTVVSDQLQTGWENIAALSASTTCALGLTADGRVEAAFFRSGDRVDVSGLENVVSLAAGATHFAFVHADGSVTVLGDNEFGQCDTAGWQLF